MTSKAFNRAIRPTSLCASPEKNMYPDQQVFALVPKQIILRHQQIYAPVLKQFVLVKVTGSSQLEELNRTIDARKNNLTQKV